MKNARLFKNLDTENINQISMHLNYEKYRKKAKQKVDLDENKYYFINHGQCLLSATDNVNVHYETIIDDTMVIATKLISERYNFMYRLTFIDNTILYCIAKDDLYTLLNEQVNTAPFFNCIIEGMENSFERLGIHIASLQIYPAEERMYSFLQGVAYLKENGDYEVNVSRKKLGEMVNLRRETSGRVLKKMEINGDIEDGEGSVIKVNKSANKLYS